MSNYKERIPSFNTYIKSLYEPVKSTNRGLEKSIDKINRMFKEAIDKAPKFKSELQIERKKLKEKLSANEITNIEYQIKEILSRYNLSYLSEDEDSKITKDDSEEDGIDKIDAIEIPENPYNNKVEKIKQWLIKNIDKYDEDEEGDNDKFKMIDDIIKHFNMEDESEDDKDKFIQLVNINLE